MWIVKLSCEHVIEVRHVYQDQSAQTERCPICDTWKDVIEWSKEQWHSRCKDCTYSRSHGMSKAFAERGAAMHRFAYGSHTTYTAFYNKGVGAEVTASDTARVMLPGFGSDTSEPPF